MTPKIKAEQIVFEIENILCPKFESGNNDYVKKCALLTVNELINHARTIAMVYDLSFDKSTNFFKQVKIEIENL